MKFFFQSMYEIVSFTVKYLVFAAEKKTLFSLRNKIDNLWSIYMLYHFICGKDSKPSLLNFL